MLTSIFGLFQEKKKRKKSENPYLKTEYISQNVKRYTCNDPNK